MKLQVTVSDDMAKRIDRISDMMGVTRSSLCAVLIGQGIMSYEKGLQQIERAGDAVIRMNAQASEDGE